MTPSLNELELDALKEMMNIGFGRAAGELSDILGTQVALAVPQIEVMRFDEIDKYLFSTMKEETGYNVIRQFFIGNFEGRSLLLLPYSQGKLFFSCFCDSLEYDSGIDIDLLEKETLLEIGNIIIGACVGKIAELLKDRVKFSPPSFIRIKADQILPDENAGEEKFVLSFKTVFQFEHQNVSGYLFLIIDYGTAKWLKDAISDFLGQYQ